MFAEPLYSLLSLFVLYLSVNWGGSYTKYLTERAQRKAFLETRRSLETRFRTQQENERQAGHWDQIDAITETRIAIFQLNISLLIWRHFWSLRAGKTFTVSSALICCSATDKRHRLRGGEVSGRVHTIAVQEDLHSQIRERIHPFCWHQGIYG